MILLAWLFGIIAFIVAVAIGVAFLNRFYRKTSRDVALIRTGFGGQKIVLAGGTLALPFLHKVDEISMRTLRVEVSRTGAKSLITEDRMRVDVELEFYLRVQPTVDGVATAAQAIGSKSLSAEGVRNLLEGRFIDAIQATAAGLTMDSLHDRRGEFVRTIGESVRVNLAHSGLQLESVSLTRMDQAAFAALDDNNAFNAVGLRKLAEIIATSKKKRAEIEADADVSVRQTQLEAIKQRLDLTRQEEQAQIAQLMPHLGESGFAEISDLQKLVLAFRDEVTHGHLADALDVCAPGDELHQMRMRGLQFSGVFHTHDAFVREYLGPRYA